MKRNRGVVLIHPYVDDGAKDLLGETRCAQCGLPKSNRSHVLKERDPNEREQEKRRMGER
jgi:hypothetical protein